MNKRKRTKIIAYVVICSLAIFSLIYLSEVMNPQTWTPQQEQTHFENTYSKIIENLKVEKNVTAVRNLFERDFNYTELCEWVYNQIEYIPLNESCNRSRYPLEIYENHEGRCEEFAIIYVAACFAHNIESRLVVATDITIANHWNDLHLWAEVRENDNWIHVDPTGNEWNNSRMYETWWWGKDIGTTVKIYAFDKDSCKEVTDNYILSQT